MNFVLLKMKLKFDVKINLILLFFFSNKKIFFFQGYIGKMSKEHEKRVKKAKKGNETLECEICCQEDLLIDDMVECTVGHLYCRLVYKIILFFY